jgi:hypothetical protein
MSASSPGSAVVSILALGSRITGKLPQDVAWAARDAVTGAVVYVVVDGASECLCGPELVRLFAQRLGRAVSREALAASESIIATLPLLDWSAPFAPQWGGLEAAEDAMRTTLDARIQSEVSLAIQEGWEEAACVLGGVLWLPDPGALMMFGVGNVATAIVTTSTERPWIIAFAGSTDSMIQATTGASATRGMSVRGTLIGSGGFKLALISDGAHAPLSSGFFVEQLRVVEALELAPTSLEAWAASVASLLRDRFDDAPLELVSENPADDATVLVADWAP